MRQAVSLARAVCATSLLLTQVGAKGGKDRGAAEPTEAVSPEDTLMMDLGQFFDGTEVQVVRVDERIGVTYPANLLFTDPYNLRFREESTAMLDLLATVLRLHPDREVWVVGHLDNALLPRDIRSRHGNHLNVAFRYAEAVYARLITEFNLDPTRFTVATRGQVAPVASNDLDSGQKQNRRVVVWIQPAPSP